MAVRGLVYYQCRYRRSMQPRWLLLEYFRTYDSRAVHEGKTLGLLGVEGGGNASTLLGRSKGGGGAGEEGGNSELHVCTVLLGEIQGNITAGVERGAKAHGRAKEASKDEHVAEVEAVRGGWIAGNASRSQLYI